MAFDPRYSRILYSQIHPCAIYNSQINTPGASVGRLWRCACSQGWKRGHLMYMFPAEAKEGDAFLFPHSYCKQVFFLESI